MREVNGIKIVEEESLGKEEINIKVAIATKLPNGEIKVNEMEGSTIICAVAEEGGHQVALIGTIADQIHAVHSIIKGIMGRAMGENTMVVIQTSAMLLAAIEDALDFDKL